MLPRQSGARLSSLLIAIIVFFGIVIEIGCAGVTSAPANSQTGTGTGSQSGTPSISLNPTSISFGTVSVGGSASQAVTVTNTGTTTLTITQATVTGQEFSLTGVTFPVSIAAGQQATATIGFSPTSAGAVTGGVAVASNASNSPLSVALSGTGVTTASVRLSWTASTSSGVTGYNIYRGTTAGSYSRISSQVAGTAYSDGSVESGQDLTYYYVVTAVNSSGQESSDSNSASVNVP